MFFLLRRFVTGCLGLVLFFSYCLCAEAFVLPGPMVLELMRNQMGSAASLKVTGEIVLRPMNLSRPPHRIPESSYYLFPEHFRSNVSLPEGELVRIVSRGRVLQAIDGFISEETRQSDVDSYKDLILYNTRQRIQERLAFWGVAVNITSLGRFDGKVAYVIGAQYPDTSSPQLWVDKETFRPWRLLLPGDTPNNPSSTEALEIRYLQWRETNGMWYPMRIEWYRDNRIVRELVADQILVNNQLSSDLFDIDTLKAQWTRKDSDHVGGDDTDTLNQMEQSIRDFKQRFE